MSDDREAARLYKLVADQGDALAQYNLWLFYWQGGGGCRGTIARPRNSGSSPPTRETQGRNPLSQDAAGSNSTRSRIGRYATLINEHKLFSVICECSCMEKGQ